ncbi:hypothetical protein HPP92_028354 [Vanilla planifolia]|uniref:Uncharacterized protein n=1 Tax=Vanilla planifolia TaxID=51239 RepID=A0A835U603_VANPL|nr:hypothetical protein HPP92_028354 [Vanilla planifolia]
MTAEKNRNLPRDEDLAKSDENVSKDMEIEDDEEQNRKWYSCWGWLPGQSGVI